VSDVATEKPRCLVCDTELPFDAAVEKAEIVECTSCGQEHEVTDVSEAGVVVDLAPEVGEDWGE
jgi:alpha-aminoadipate carrier protein LysW